MHSFFLFVLFVFIYLSFLFFSNIEGLKKLHKIVQERLTDASTPLPLNSPTKSEGLESVKKMEMRMEEKPEETSKLKQLNTSSTKLDAIEPGKEKPNKGYNGLDVSNTDKKRIFIRSRL